MSSLTRILILKIKKSLILFLNLLYNLRIQNKVTNTKIHTHYLFTMVCESINPVIIVSVKNLLCLKFQIIVNKLLVKYIYHITISNFILTMNAKETPTLACILLIPCHFPHSKLLQWILIHTFITISLQLSFTEIHICKKIKKRKANRKKINISRKSKEGTRNLNQRRKRKKKLKKPDIIWRNWI